jgi:hypothetical protein
MYFADIDSSVLGSGADANYAFPVSLFLREPCAPAFQRDQGGARKRARSIMTGNASGGKKDLLAEAF